ncbi:DNA primase [Flavobacterium psychrophilum]|nr:DNA primase [Flavobacterium psychrophilum]AOE54278.1 DNA primase [Flavobacterium psychrophilum]
MLPHYEILQELIEQIEQLDFHILAFPEILKLREKLVNTKPESEEADNLRKRIDKHKINNKHLLVLSIENLISIATSNRWGLCKNNDFIYLYNSTYWAAIEEPVFQKFLGEAAEKMGVTKFSARFYQFRESLLKQFLATAYLPSPKTDNSKVLINLQNGTFEISGNDLQLRPFNHNDFITYQLPFDYDPQAKAPLFEKYLNTVLPDIQRQKVLAEYLGYVFIKNGSNAVKEEKALILYGTGANGKSVFFEVVSALLGTENTSNFSLQSLTNDNGYFRAAIANKLVNYASEINGKLDAAIFKQLTSGEPVEARHPYGRAFQISQYAKLIFNCNELPKDVEQTNAFFRRFLIIPFDVTIPTEQQDKQLHTKIIENELSGVFNWVLDGLNRLLEQKRFSDCDAAQVAVEQYKTQSDSVKMFVDENGFIKSAAQYKLIKELYQEYRSFCSEDGFIPVNKSNFIKRLSAIEIYINRINIGNVAYIESKANF